MYDEYWLTIMASDSDSGSPTRVRFRVWALRVVTLASNTGPSLEDIIHVTQVMGNTRQFVVLGLANKLEKHIRVQGAVKSMVDERVDDLFRTELSQTEDCKLILAWSELDHGVMA